MLAGERYVSGDSNTVASAGLSILLCPLFLLMKGEEAVIPAHTKIEARVAGSYMIERVVITVYIKWISTSSPLVAGLF